MTVKVTVIGEMLPSSMVIGRTRSTSIRPVPFESRSAAVAVEGTGPAMTEASYSYMPGCQYSDSNVTQG